MQAGLLDTYQQPGAEPAVAGLGALRASWSPSYLRAVLHRASSRRPRARSGLGSKWTLYGLVYSLAMVVGGVVLPAPPRQQPLPAHPHASVVVLSRSCWPSRCPS